MTRSLRRRLLLGTTITFVLILAFLGIAVDTAVRRTVTAQFDTALLAKAQALSSMLEQHGERVKFEFDPHDMPEFNAARHAAFFELWVNGRPFAKSPSLESQILFSDVPTVESTTFRPMPLPDGRHGRAVLFPCRAYDDDDDGQNAAPATGIIVVAMSTHTLDHTLFVIRCTIFGLCVFAVCLSGAALLWVVSRALRPINMIAGQIEQVGESTLSTRLETREVPSEVRPLVDRLNGLLQRLEQAFDRERAFTADVAHELRTPIAGLRTMFEVCRSRTRDPAGYAATIDRALGIIQSMQTVIENLLLLARAESGELAADATDFDLVGLLRESWFPFAARAEERNLLVSWQLPDRCALFCDVPSLRIVVSNLFDNAVSYADAGGALRIHLHSAAGTLKLTVANSGCEILPSEIPHLYQRFWRKDPARSQTGVHAGLGLSLCQRLLSLIRGSIEIRVEEGWFVVCCTLPTNTSVSVTPPPLPRESSLHQ